MMNRLFICGVFFMLGALFVNGKAQSFSGKVIDETGEALAFANVVLFQLPDTATVKYHSATDLHGRFAIEGVALGSYLCQVSFIGYRTVCDTLHVAEGQTALAHNYRMELDAQMVGEVVVTGSKQTASVGKLSYLITPKERQGRTNAFEMMSALPGIRIDLMNRTITSSAGGSVMILINGLSSNATDLQAIRPNDVVRVEHYEIP
ncbi:MAG: carboxypeptidase-like regulatory domain-containing protein, partial [Prevotellaceae bacterium]|nr:carboxypeptidase-like regulatory domain-containing protein [Prevotellaceae bacterium]